MTRLKSCSKCFVLVCCVSKGTCKLRSNPGRLGSSILFGFTKFLDAIEARDTDTTFNRFKNFKRWWRKSIIPIDYGSYGKFLFNFLKGSFSGEVPSSSEHTHLKGINFKWVNACYTH